MVETPAGVQRLSARAVCALLLASGALLAGQLPATTIGHVTGGGDAAAASAPGRGPARSVGCGVRGRETRHASDLQSIMVDGTTHEYLERLPTVYRPRHPAPMIVQFHGYGSDALGMAELTQLPGRGAQRGFVVVTPDGPGHTWQLSGRGSDAGYVEAAMAKVEDSLCIDLDRVYAAGFSQGAAFTILLACSHPGQFAAIATVAVEFRLGCSAPLPLLAFHGTADPAVPYRNGATGLSLPGVKVRGTLLNMGDWARLDHCRGSPVVRRVGSDVQRRAWPSCAHGAQVILYSVLAGGHTWPGAARRASPMYTTETVSATNLALTFFSQHERHSSRSL